MANAEYDTSAQQNPAWSDDLHDTEIATALELISRQQARDVNTYVLNEAAARLRSYAAVA